MSTWPSLLAAETTLLARRRDQRGAPTFGDDADRALWQAIADLPADAAGAAHATGRRLGDQVYARRFVEDALPHAVGVLAHALAASGFGALRLEHAFHRSARLRFDAPEGLPAEPARAFAAGATEGFFSHAFNCHARATPRDGVIHLELGEGRNVNRKGATA